MKNKFFTKERMISITVLTTIFLLIGFLGDYFILEDDKSKVLCCKYLFNKIPTAIIFGILMSFFDTKFSKKNIKKQSNLN